MSSNVGTYWDCNEAAWVAFAVPEIEVPAQAEPVEDELAAERVAALEGADVRSG